MTQKSNIWAGIFPALLGLVLAMLWTLCLALPLAAQSSVFNRSQALSSALHPEGPMQVSVAIQIDQITGIDQKAENYGAVAVIRMEWHDPVLAELNDTDDVLVMEGTDFQEAALETGFLVPGFVIQNQQGNRWIQQSKVAIWPNGQARYYERATVTLQAPYFNFRRYPFDRQIFFFEIVSLYPLDVVEYTPNPELSGLGELLGEEEWILNSDRMVLGEVEGISGEPSAKAALAFEGHRHLAYYMLQMFLPMLVLIAVSWATFFLGEYRKRIEVAGANLLVFVAFNWMVSDGLPKLGYLTFLDFVLQCMFVVTGMIIVFNVILSRLKNNGRGGLAASLDRWVILWIYPLGYAGVMIFAVLNYLVY